MLVKARCRRCSSVRQSAELTIVRLLVDALTGHYVVVPLEKVHNANFVSSTLCGVED